MQKSWHSNKMPTTTCFSASISSLSIQANRSENFFSGIYVNFRFRLLFFNSVISLRNRVCIGLWSSVLPNFLLFWCISSLIAVACSSRQWDSDQPVEYFWGLPCPPPCWIWITFREYEVVFPSTIAPSLMLVLQEDGSSIATYSFAASMVALSFQWYVFLIYSRCLLVWNKSSFHQWHPRKVSSLRLVLFVCFPGFWDQSTPQPWVPVWKESQLLCWLSPKCLPLWS